MKSDAPTTKSIIAFFETHAQSEQAVAKLEENGFDMKSISIIAMNLVAVESVKGYYTVADYMKKWALIGAFYGGLWGLLFGATTYSIPFFGPILISGPLTTITVALACAVALGIVSALGAALYNIRLSAKHKLKYETEIKAGKYMLLTQGDSKMIDQAREILEFHIPKEFAAVTEWELSLKKAKEVVIKEPEAINLDKL